jgi:hypothetical protein
VIRSLARHALARPLVALTLAAAVAGCDTTFGERPIGGGQWEGVHTTVRAPASEAWRVVEATLEEVGAGKAIPYPEGAETAVRVTWDGGTSDAGDDALPGRWMKVAVDPARAYDSVLSAYAMNDLGLAQDLTRELVAALREAGFEVEEPEFRTAHEVDHQRIAARRPYPDGYWSAPEADHHHDDEHHHHDDHDHHHADGDHGGDGDHGDGDHGDGDHGDGNHGGGDGHHADGEAH